MMKILTTFGATLALTATMSAGYAGEGRKDLQVFNDISKADAHGPRHDAV